MQLPLHPAVRQLRHAGLLLQLRLGLLRGRGGMQSGRFASLHDKRRLPRNSDLQLVLRVGFVRLRIRKNVLPERTVLRHMPEHGLPLVTRPAAGSRIHCLE
jgi:hypothetical protein